jgi:polyferredoxin
MEKMGYPKGLVKYTTENALEGKKGHLLRPRVIVYTILLTALVGALGWGLATRIPLEVDIIRDRNALYSETDMGLVENVYNLKFINMAEQPQRYNLSISGISGLQVVGPTSDIEVDSGAVKDVPLRVRVDPIELKQASTEIIFHIESQTDSAIRLDQHARFLGPVLR